MSKTHSIPSAKQTALPSATTPVVPATAPKAPVVALRGGAAISHVKLGAANYRVTAPHNVAWWATVNQQLSANNGVAPVADILKAGVPAIMVGYLVRRGYLAATTV